VLSSTPSTRVSSQRLSSRPTRLSACRFPRLAPTFPTSFSTPPSHGTVLPTSRVRSRSSASSSWRTSRSTRMKPPKMSSNLVSLSFSNVVQNFKLIFHRAACMLLQQALSLSSCFFLTHYRLSKRGRPNQYRVDVSDVFPFTFLFIIFLWLRA
jgi:hypothetical protein